MTFLGVLKIIGFVLLGILALILLIILLILVWPFRYKIEADYHKDFKAKFTLSFFFKAIRVLFTFEEFKPLLKAKVLWFTVYTYDFKDLFGEDEEEPAPEEPDLTDEELDALLTGAENADVYEKQADGSWESMGRAKEDDSGEGTEGNATETPEGKGKSTGEGETSGEGESAEDEWEIPEDEVEAFVEEELKKKQSLEDIILEFIDNIKKGIQKLKKKCYNLKVKVEDLQKKVKYYYKVAKYYYKVLNYKSMKPALKMVIKTLKGILKHVRPRKVRINVHYGADDPSETAKALAIYSMIYPYFRKQIRFQADFDNKIIEADGWIKGRFHLFILAFYAIRCYLCKHVRIMIKLFMREGKKHG